jgi:polycomb protein EED
MVRLYASQEERVLTFIQLINDLAISPLTPRILASGSMDHSIRIWSLDPAHAKSPTMVKCGGSGHKEGILTIVCCSLH